MQGVSLSKQAYIIRMVLTYEEFSRTISSHERVEVALIRREYEYCTSAHPLKDQCFPRGASWRTGNTAIQITSAEDMHGFLHHHQPDIMHKCADGETYSNPSHDLCSAIRTMIFAAQSKSQSLQRSLCGLWHCHHQKFNAASE